MMIKFRRGAALWAALLAVIVLAGVVACGSQEEAASAEDIAAAVQAQMGPQLTAADVQKIVRRVDGRRADRCRRAEDSQRLGGWRAYGCRRAADC
jgi:hypothetical protein